MNGLFQRRASACHRMGQGGQFGHSRAGVRYFHRELLESSNLQRGGPRSLYFPQTHSAAFNLLKILYPDTKLHGHATELGQQEKSRRAVFWKRFSYDTENRRFGPAWSTSRVLNFVVVNVL